MRATRLLASQPVSERLWHPRVSCQACFFGLDVHTKKLKTFEGSVALLPKQLNTQLSNPLNAS